MTDQLCITVRVLRSAFTEKILIPLKATISSIYRTIGSMTKLNTLVLDEVPITDSLQDVFNNQSLKYLTLRRPRKRFNQARESEQVSCCMNKTVFVSILKSKLNYGNTEDLEAVLRKIGHLRNLEHLRLVISNDTEHAFANENAAANNHAAPAMIDAAESRLAYSNAYSKFENFEGTVRKTVLEMLSNLANQLTRLELNGSWICDSLVIQMPCLPNLEALRLIPAQSRVVVYGLVSKIHFELSEFSAIFTGNHPP